jgi:K+-sensing histidine kinase KdpD
MSTRRECIDPSTELLLLTLFHEVLDKTQAIKSYATLALDLSEDPIQKESVPNQRKWLEAILMEVDEIPYIVKDVSRIIQAIRGTFELSEHAILADLESILKDIVDVILTSTPHCQLRLDIDTTLLPFTVFSPDDELLCRSLELILGYLVALTPNHGMLKISLSTKSKRILTTICGEGVIEYESLSPTEFTQTPFKGAPSISTGMDIARKIIQSHGGQVQLNESNDCLSIELPFGSFAPLDFHIDG